MKATWKNLLVLALTLGIFPNFEHRALAQDQYSKAAGAAGAGQANSSQQAMMLGAMAAGSKDSQTSAMLQMMMIQQMAQSAQYKSSKDQNQKNSDSNSKNPVPSPSNMPSPSAVQASPVDDKDTLQFVDKAQKQEAELQDSAAKEDKSSSDSSTDFPSLKIPTPAPSASPVAQTETGSQQNGMTLPPGITLSPIPKKSEEGAGNGLGNLAPVADKAAGNFGFGRAITSVDSKPGAAEGGKAAETAEEAPVRLRKKGVEEDPGGSGGAETAEEPASGGNSLMEDFLAKMSGQSGNPEPEFASADPGPEAGPEGNEKPMSIFAIAHVRFQYAAFAEKRLRLAAPEQRAKPPVASPSTFLGGL